MHVCEVLPAALKFKNVSVCDACDADTGKVVQ